MKKILIPLIAITLFAACNQNEKTGTSTTSVTANSDTSITTPPDISLPPGPDANVKITEAYARMIARDAYFWAWPMENIYNRRLAFKQSPQVGLMNGVLPFAPLNNLAMLDDYIQPEQRWVACPNQDVVYGAAIAALDETPVVVQVPDFGDRFWCSR